MTARQYIVTNFAYGTGPYLHATELAVAFNDELERLGKERARIIVPLVYGERQRAVMQEEFADFLRERPDEILLDETLGAMLREIFYDGSADYAVSLARWVERVRDVSSHAREHLCGTFTVETFGGERHEVDGRQIIVELSRSPRLRLDIAPAYSTTFGFLSDIFTHTLGEPADAIAIPEDALRRGTEAARWIEDGQRMHAVGFPGTFTSDLSTELERENAFLTPPLTSQRPKPHPPLHGRGILVTVTGISGLERLYEGARELGLTLYSTTEGVPEGSVRVPPDVIIDQNIAFQFARAGWGSIWLSLNTGVPIVVPAFDTADDPEIYFNNRMVEQLGMGIVYRGEPLGDIMERLPAVCSRQQKLRDDILSRWGTLDGHNVSAEKFVDDFLRRA
jgi:hypothetical protein